MTLSAETPLGEIVLRYDNNEIAWLTLNRPHAYNALSVELMTALQKALNEIKNDSKIKIVVLKGAGAGFCAGHDLKQMQANRNETFFKNFFDQCSILMQTILNLPQPVIAQVHGTAAAAGCQLVATCDLAFAAKDATFATPGVNIGLFCSTPMVAVSRKIPRKKMMEMLLLGELIDADTAEKIGLINQAVPAGILAETIQMVAETITAKSPLVVKIGKQAFYKQAEMPLADAYRYTGEVMTQNMLAQDANEGINAFIQKRTPIWQGK